MRSWGSSTSRPTRSPTAGATDATEAAVAHGLALAAAGAALLDVGGESTRPGASPVDAAEELRRTQPVVRELAAGSPVPVSIDTTKARIAAGALDAGATMVNDVSGGVLEPDILRVVADTGALLVVMHTHGYAADDALGGQLPRRRPRGR